MDGFSAISVTSTCGTISHRALSAAVEIDDITKDGPAAHPGIKKLRFLGSKLHQFRQHTDQLQHCLSGSTISGTLQGVISRSLGQCDSATAMMDKQVKRLGPPAAARLNLGAISRFEDLLVSYSRLFIFVMQLLSMHDTASQDSKLKDAVGLQLVDNAEASAAGILSGIDILGTVNGSVAAEGSNSDFREGTSSSTAVETNPQPSDDEQPPALPQRPRKSGIAKGVSSLTNTLKAVTSSIRPRPEPFVSPLCQAASGGNLAHVKGLLAQGANINGRNEEGNTALICAIISSQSETTTLLLQYGADVTVRDSARKRRPPLFHALGAGNLHIAELLLKNGARVKEKNLIGQPYFVDVALTEPLDAVRLCLKYGADANAKDITGRAIVCHAATRGNVALVSLLLEHGADPNSRDVIGNTLLLASIRNDRLEPAEKDPLIRLLLAHGADTNEPDTWGVTALAHAAAADNVELMRALLDCGADPHRSVHGDSLLVNAIDAGRWDQVWTLVECGCRRGPVIDAPGARGRTPLEAAVQSQNPDVVQLLLRHGVVANGRAG